MVPSIDTHIVSGGKFSDGKIDRDVIEYLKLVTIGTNLSANVL